MLPEGYLPFGLTRGRKPAATIFFCPAVLRTLFTNARAAALFWLADDDRDAVLHLRLRPRREPQDLHLARNRPRVGRVDEAGVGLAERDLREHLAHVRLAADDVLQHAREPHVPEDLDRVAPTGTAGPATTSFVPDLRRS